MIFLFFYFFYCANLKSINIILNDLNEENHSKRCVTKELSNVFQLWSMWLITSVIFSEVEIRCKAGCFFDNRLLTLSSW